MLEMLIVTGGLNPGHTRNTAWVEKLFESYYEITTICLAEMEEINIFDFGILFVFTSLESATDNQLHLITSYSNSNDKTLFFLHEAAIYNRNNKCFLNCIGVRYKEHGNYKKMKIQICDSIDCQKIGENSFLICDELYSFDLEPPIFDRGEQAILRESVTKKVVGYKRLNEFNTKVIYISIGHDDSTLMNTTFQKVILSQLLSSQ